MHACSAHAAAAALQSPAAASFPRLLPEHQAQVAGLLRGLPNPVGLAAPDPLAGRQIPDALDGPQLRQRVQVGAGVPERLLRRVGQSAARVHRRRQHRLLPVEQREVPGAPRRDRHGAAGDGAGGAVHAADQRVRARQRRRHHRRPGDEVPPLVRPHRRLPPLRHHLEPRPDPVPGGRRADQAVREEDGGDVPGQGDVGVRLHLGRLRLGHRRRPLPRRLQVPAVRVAVRRPQDRRVRRGGRAARWLPARAGVAVGVGAQHAAGGRHAVGAAQLHGVLLLPRLVQGPRALPRVLIVEPTALLRCRAEGRCNIQLQLPFQTKRVFIKSNLEGKMVIAQKKKKKEK